MTVDTQKVGRRSEEVRRDVRPETESNTVELAITVTMSKTAFWYHSSDSRQRWMSCPFLRHTKRTVTGRLLQEGLLVSDSPKGPVRLGYSADASSHFFPNLFPDGAEQGAPRSAWQAWWAGYSVFTFRVIVPTKINDPSGVLKMK